MRFWIGFLQNLTGFEENSSPQKNFSLSNGDPVNLQYLITRSLLKSAELGAFVSNALKTDTRHNDSPEVDVLEERIMLSAAPIAVAAEPDMPSAADQADVSADSADADQNNAQSVTSIVFIDSAVDDLQQLVDDFSQETSAGVEIVLLDSDRDGIEQISEVLSQRSGIESVHIVSHGSDGSIQLGSTQLNSQTLSQYAGEIAKWNLALTPDADLLIYGCDLAATEDGRELVDSISALTGSDVAASDDLTGHADLGGDWEFEYVVGEIESEVAFSVDARQNWRSTLATFTVTTQDDVVDANDGVLSLREAIIAANGNGVADTIILGSGVHNLTINGSSNTTGDLDIFSEIRIVGAADGSTTIDGSALNDRIFHVQIDTTILQSLTITGGSTTESAGGGGLLLSGGATAIVENVDFVGNTATTGGAIRSSGDLTLTDSSLRGNIGTVDGGGLVLSDQFATLENVTISGNETDGRGGGVFVGTGGHTFTNVTISGNQAVQPGESGGGIAIANGKLGLQQVTITDNASLAGSGVAIASGSLNVTNSIIAGNNLSADVILFSGNNNADANSIVGSDAGLLLAPLADNGGPVETHELLTGSVAINSAGAAGISETDARGFLVRDGSRDVGAFERGATPNGQSGLVAEDDNFEVNEDGVLNVTSEGLTSNDFDPDGDVLSVNTTPIVGPTNGTLSLSSNGLFTYTPDADFNGSDSFTYEVNDGNGTIAEATVNITVTAVNDAPLISTNSGKTIQQGAADVITSADLNASDIDDAGIGLTYTVNVLPVNGAVALSGTALGIGGTFTQADIDAGRVTYQHDGSATSSDSFEFSLADGGEDGATTDSGIFNFLILANNEAPIVDLDADNSSGATGSNFSSVYPGSGTVSLFDTDVTLFDDSGSIEFITISFPDGTGGYSLQVDDSVSPNVTAFTPFDSVLTLTGPASTAEFEAVLRTVEYFSTTGGSTTPVQVDVVVNDGQVSGEIASTTITLNRDPIASDEVYGLEENGILRVTSRGVLANDSDLDDGDTLTVNTTPIIGPTNGSLTLNSDGTFTYTPDANFNGTDSFTYQISDGNGGTAQATASITVNAVNSVPEIIDLDANVAFAEGMTPIVLDSDVVIFDVEFQLADNYGGSTLSIGRAGGASAEDVFSNTGLLGTLTEGGNLFYDGVGVGFVSANSGGELILEFNSNATQEIVNDIARSIAYSNSSDVPPASVDLVWVFNDQETDELRRDVSESVSSQITVDITRANNAPVLPADAAVAVTENTFLVGTFSGNDPDGDTLTYSLAGADAELFSIDSATGEVSFILAPDVEAPGDANSDNVYEITVVATDNGTGMLSDSQNVLVTVTDTNEFDVGTLLDINSVLNEVDENAAIGTVVGITASAFDNDATNNSVTYQLQDDDGGRFEIDPVTGVVTVSDNIDFETEGASRNITVRAESSDGSFSEQVFIVAVNEVNESGTGTDATITLAEDSQVSFQASDFGFFDVDGDTLQGIVIRTLPSNGSLTLNGSAVSVGDVVDVAELTDLVFTPAENAFGMNYDSLEFIVQDSRQLVASSSNTITFDVTPVNDAPIVDLDADDSGGITGTGFATSFSAGDAPVAIVDGASVTDVDSTIETLTVTLTDGLDGTLEGLNFTTVSGIDAVYDGASGVLVLTNDGTASNADFAQVLNTLEYFNSSTTPTETVRAITFVVNDGLLNSSTAVANVTISGDTTAPTVVSNMVIWVDEGGQEFLNQFELFSTDDLQPSSSITYTITTGPNAGHLAFVADSSTPITSFTQQDIDLQRVIYVHDRSEVTADRFEFTVNDGVGNGVSGQFFDIFVVPQNDAPDVAVPLGTQSVQEDGVLTFGVATGNAISISDVDANGAGIQVTLTSTNGTLNLSQTTGLSFPIGAGMMDSPIIIQGTVDALNAAFDGLTYRPDADFNGPASVTILVDDLGNTGDGGSGTDMETINIDVVSVNDAPSTTSVSITGNEDADFIMLTVGGIDQDGSVTDIRVDSLPANGTLFADSELTVPVVAGTDSPATGGQSTFYFVPDDDFTGSASFEVSARDDSGEYDPSPATVTINVSPINDAPVLPADAVVTVTENTSLVGTFSGNDPDGDTLTYSLTGADAGLFSINSATGEVSFVLAPDAEAPRDANSDNVYEITVVATDNGTGMLSDSQNVSVTVTDINEFDVGTSLDSNPILNEVDENAAIGTTVGLTVEAIDSDATNNSVTYQLQDDDGGRFEIDPVTGVVTVAGNIDFETEGASRNITVRAESSDGSFTEQVFTVAVNDVNEAPTVAITGIVLSIPEDADTTNGVSIADIVVTDDALGTNSLSLSGSDAGVFEIVGNELRLRAGTNLDFESATQYDVNVEVNDATLGTGADDIVSHRLNVSGVEDQGPVIGPAVPVGLSGPSDGGSSAPSIGTPNVVTSTPSVDETNDPVETASENAVEEEATPVTAAQIESRSSSETEVNAESEGESELVDVLLNDSFNFEAENQLQLGQESQDTLEARLKSLRRLGLTQSGGVAYSSSLATQVPLTVAFSENTAESLESSDEKLGKFLSGTYAVTTASLSVGYVLWLIRGGSLIASFTSALPAWTSMDPLSIVAASETDKNSEGGESLLEMVDGNSNE